MSHRRWSLDRTIAQREHERRALRSFRFSRTLAPAEASAARARLLDSLRTARTHSIPLVLPADIELTSPWDIFTPGA